MAIDVYLQIDGIKGESQDSAHQSWIELTSAHWGVTQPAPAPRLSRTPGAIRDSDEEGAAVLARWREELS